MDSGIVAAPIAVPQADLDDLRERLTRTRWPELETVHDWSQGAPRAKVWSLCEYWRAAYDWRRCEAMLNQWNPQRTVIDGLGIHFFQLRSPEPDALPVIMTHGWPGSVIEFHKVAGPLTNPRAHGGDPGDAVHLVLPSLPGFGFSDKPAGPGWGVRRTAQAWTELMRRLGYGKRWAAQGGDWGGEVTVAIGARQPAGCLGIHLSSLGWDPSEDQVAAANGAERRLLERKQRFDRELSGYARVQSTRPQTLGYGLADSPAGQAAWIYEKFHDWTDNPEAPEDIFTRDEMLDNIMLYWITGSGASSARLYWEERDTATQELIVDLPSAFSLFPRDFEGPSVRWAAEQFRKIVCWSRPGMGGHFAAFEQPEIFVSEVRTALRAIRQA